LIIVPALSLPRHNGTSAAGMSMLERVRALKGWLGIHLGARETHWDKVAEFIATSYCLIAPRRLARQITRPPSFEC
jgi:hypothetical protein